MIDSRPDAKTLAYINLYGILGTLENLLELDPDARALLHNKKPITVAFDVKGGPKASITFAYGFCRMKDRIDECDIKLPFSSCEKFNGMIDGTVTPIPSKGFTHLGFLLKDFQDLTDRLTKYLRPDPKDLEDKKFFDISTSLMLYLIGVAIAQIGNNDEVGRFSASYIADGSILLGVKDGPAATIYCKNHRLLTLKKRTDDPRAFMEFDSIELARDLFDGKVNAVASIGTGLIRIGGLISMVDNVNRILDRVGLYLA
ncbi:MAG: hypothetical protein K6C36_00910 [Clostridia bacterium]|nr:hypothetical protein [Clostridia bacterium]